MNGFYWLASYPKSGNTWMRLALWALNHGKPVDFAAFPYWIPLSASRLLFDDALGVESSDLTHTEIECLRPRAFEVMARNADQPMLRKVDEAWIRTAAGEPLFPPSVTLGTILIVRDPRDVAVSLAHHMGMGIDEAIRAMANPRAGFCAQVRQADHQLWRRLLTWSGHVESWLDAPDIRLLLVRYEDMIARMPEELGRVARFLGWDTSAAALAAAAEEARFDRLRAQEERHGFAERPVSAERFFRRGKAGGWRDTLSPAQAARIESDHAAVMTRLGYL